ncbi:MAG: sulfatase [Puniceicoccaceae bacterium]
MKAKLITFLLLVACAALPANGKTLPNIVLLLSDDLGRLETSVYGSTEVRTPTLATLAEKGMTFDNAYVASPSCCPNRASLLTGLMPARHGAHPNHTFVKEGTKWLPPILKEMGYTVASFGKVQHGRRDFEGCDYHFTEHEKMSQDLEKLIQSGKLGDGPVCLMVGDRRPHVPWIEEWIYDPEKVTLPHNFIDTPETREHWARYYSDITHMDAEMGRVLKLVEKHLGSDFICMFTSDHGGQWPFGKWNLYDSGARIPLIATWPGHIESGVRTDAMVNWVDIIPTLIDLGGGDVPTDIDGKSFADVLLGKKDTHRSEIFTTHTGDTVFNVYPIRSIREGRYKYIHNLCPDGYHSNHSDILQKDGAGEFWAEWFEAAKTDPAAAKVVKAYQQRPEFELFDLDKDPMEQNNLAENPEYREILLSLKRKLADWTTSQGDDLKPHQAIYPLSAPMPDIKTQHEKRLRERAERRKAEAAQGK